VYFILGYLVQGLSALVSARELLAVTRWSVKDYHHNPENLVNPV